MGSPTGQTDHNLCSCCRFGYRSRRPSPMRLRFFKSPGRAEIISRQQADNNNRFTDVRGLAGEPWPRPSRPRKGATSAGDLPAGEGPSQLRTIWRHFLLNALYNSASKDHTIRQRCSSASRPNFYPLKWLSWKKGAIGENHGLPGARTSRTAIACKCMVSTYCSLGSMTELLASNPRCVGWMALDDAGRDITQHGFRSVSENLAVLISCGLDQERSAVRP